MVIAHRGIVSGFFYSEYCQREHLLSGRAWYCSLDLDDNCNCAGRVGTLSENAGLMNPVWTMETTRPALGTYPVASAVIVICIWLFLHEHFKGSALTIGKHFCFLQYRENEKSPVLVLLRAVHRRGKKEERPVSHYEWMDALSIWTFMLLSSFLRGAAHRRSWSLFSWFVKLDKISETPVFSGFSDLVLL